MGVKNCKKSKGKNETEEIKTERKSTRNDYGLRLVLLLNTEKGSQTYLCGANYSLLIDKVNSN